MLWSSVSVLNQQHSLDESAAACGMLEKGRVVTEVCVTRLLMCRTLMKDTLELALEMLQWQHLQHNTNQVSHKMRVFLRLR